MAHIFVSYVRDNSSEVDRLAAILRGFQVEVWLDRDSLSAGQRWKDAIRTAIQDGAFFLACFSREYEARGPTHMNEELLLAIEQIRLRPHDTAWFIPVLLNETRLPDRPIGPGETLADIQAIKLYPNWEQGVRNVLKAIQPTSAVVYELTQSLSNPSARVRISAADELSKLGALAATSTNELRVLLSDENETVRAAAANALAAIGVCDERIVMDLLRIVGDDGHSDYPRMHASRALASMSNAVPYLIDIASTQSGRVAEAALETIVAAGRKALHTLHEVVIKGGPGKLVALEALARIPQSNTDQSDQQRLIESLLLSLKNATEEEKPAVIGALGALGTPAAVESLIRELADENYVCVAAAFALQRIGDPRAIKPLSAVLSDTRRFWVARGAAAVALGHFGSAATVALPALQKALTYPFEGDTWDERARDAVIDAISHLQDSAALCQLRARGYRYEMWGIY